MSICKRTIINELVSLWQNLQQYWNNVLFSFWLNEDKKITLRNNHVKILLLLLSFVPDEFSHGQQLVAFTGDQVTASVSALHDLISDYCLVGLDLSLNCLVLQLLLTIYKALTSVGITVNSFFFISGKAQILV